jgi:hypothetical protein
LSTEFDDLAYVNKETDRIIIGTSKGLLQCYREANQDYPLVHIVLSKPEEEAPLKKPARGQPADAAKPAATDEQGTQGPTDPGADPFATPPAGAEPPAMEEKPAEESKPAENPFGE